MTDDREGPRDGRRHGLRTQQASCALGTSTAMAGALHEKLSIEDGKGVLLFAPSTCDLDGLATELSRRLGVPMFGCTTAGAIGPDGWTSGVVAVAFGGDVDFDVFPIELERRAADLERCTDCVRELAAVDPARHTVCVVLHDGLSGVEETLNSDLQMGLGPVPLVGGSAGDDLSFRSTRVLVGDRFRSRTSGLLAIRTHAPIHLFKFQHFAPGDSPLVITAADPSTRTVFEIDGRPAVEAYCERTRVAEADLGPQHFARHPLVVELEGDAYVRSIQRRDADGSLRLFCAIEEGVVATIGADLEPLAAAREALAAARRGVGATGLVLGFDCILRALEAQDRAFAAPLEALYREHRVLGFHTYGETIHGLHVNQTFTGLCFGRDS